LRTSEGDRADFIQNQVSGVKNRIEVDRSHVPTTLSIFKCSCCKSCPQSPVAEAMKPENGEEVFSRSLDRFKEVELPLNDSVEVHLVDLDSCPRKLRLSFVWRNRAFEELHEQLCAEYKNNIMSVENVHVGMVCALPFENTKDYHRGIVKDVSDSSLPVVYYVDLGIAQGVARGCIRLLYEKFYSVPTFCLTGEVRGSLRYSERDQLSHKLRKKERVFLTAERYDRMKKRYLLILDPDSGIMSDSGRD